MSKSMLVKCQRAVHLQTIDLQKTVCLSVCLYLRKRLMVLGGQWSSLGGGHGVTTLHEV